MQKCCINEYVLRRRRDKQKLKERVFEIAAEKFLGRPLRPNEDYISIENALREIQKNLTLV